MAAAGNFHILDTEYKRTWQDLEVDEHSRRDHIPGDTHNNHHPIGSAPVEAGKKSSKGFRLFFVKQNKKQNSIDRNKNYLLVCRATTP